jgi:hypothetical protein
MIIKLLVPWFHVIQSLAIYTSSAFKHSILEFYWKSSTVSTRITTMIYYHNKLRRTNEGDCDSDSITCSVDIVPCNRL